DLHPAATFVVGRRNLQRRDEAAEGEVADLFEAVLDIGPGRRLAAVRFQRVTDSLDMNGGLQEAAVVIDAVLVHQVERLLARLLVHRLDLLTNRVVVAGAGELHRVIAFGDAKAARRVDVGLGGGPDQADYFRQRIAVRFKGFDRRRGRPAEEM